MLSFLSGVVGSFFVFLTVAELELCFLFYWTITSTELELLFYHRQSCIRPSRVMRFLPIFSIILHIFWSVYIYMCTFWVARFNIWLCWSRNPVLWVVQLVVVDCCAFDCVGCVTQYCGLCNILLWVDCATQCCALCRPLLWVVQRI